MLPRVTQSSLYQLILVSRDLMSYLAQTVLIIGDKTNSVRMLINNLFDIRYGVSVTILITIFLSSGIKEETHLNVGYVMAASRPAIAA